MSKKRDIKREAMVARIEDVEAKAAKALSGLKAKFTRYTGLTDALKRLKRELRDYDFALQAAALRAAVKGTDAPAPAPQN